MRKGEEGEKKGGLVAGSPIISDNIGSTSFGDLARVLACKGFDSFSHSRGSAEAFFSDQVGRETSDVGSCCVRILESISRER